MNGGRHFIHILATRTLSTYSLDVYLRERYRYFIGYF